jgi:mycothiol synthase
MNIRTITAKDHAALAQLCRVELTRDPFAEEIPSILMRHRHVGLAAVDGGEVVGCGFGSPSRFGEPGDAHLDLLVVAATHRRRGIGRELLARLEADLLAAGCSRLLIEGNAPSYAWAGLDIHYTSGLCFVERMGFIRGRCVVNMDVDLTSGIFSTEAAQHELLSDGITFRRGSSEDASTTTGELAERWKARWIEELGMALRGPGAVYFAEQGGRCVGFGAFGLNRPHELGPLGVEPAVRHRGVGEILLKLCCSEQLARGLTRAELQWAGPLAYFSDALKATTGRVFWMYAKPLAPTAAGSAGPRRR